MNPAYWSDHEWDRKIQSPEWANSALSELKQLFEEGFIWLSPVTLIDASLVMDADGVAVLVLIYDDRRWEKRTGLRRRLDRRPTSLAPGQTAERSLAIDIAMSDLGEPLGTIYSRLVPDDEGVWWWGDGFGS